MLSHPIRRFLDTVFLRISGGDPIRADERRASFTGGFLAFMMVSYVPLVVGVALLVINRPQQVDTFGQQDQLTMVEAFATRYVDTYLKNPGDTQAIKQFYDGDIVSSELPVGGRALRVSSALPGLFVDGFQTYSVVVDAEIPKAANAESMVSIRLQVDLSADRNNRLRAFTLPHARPDRPSGQPVELATQMTVAEGRPVYNTAKDFLAAMLCGIGDITPYVSYGSSLTAQVPPRFTTMSVERVLTNSEVANAQDVPPKADRIEVTVRAVLQTPSGVLMPMDFPLVMSVNAGHWQVDQINDSPSILSPGSSDLDTRITTPSTTPTTTAYTSGSTSLTTLEGN